MKLTIKAKLLTIPEQHQSLKKTMEIFNDACNHISQRTFETKTQSRFQKDTNHKISKQIIAKAKGTQRAIALEDLSGIRLRQKVRKADKQRFGNWAFFQLDSFLGYKAKIAGVPVVYVDPRNTSHTCSICGFVSKTNRKSQSIFSCFNCGFTANADFVGAVNIASKAIVNQPFVVHLPILHAPFIGTASPQL